MKANRVLLIGYVGKDPASILTKKGAKKVSIRLATHYKKKTAGGNHGYQTVWHDVVAWDQRAEQAERNFVKGSRILVEGFVDYRTYPDASGHIRYITEIRADNLLNLDR